MMKKMRTPKKGKRTVEELLRKIVCYFEIFNKASFQTKGMRLTRRRKRGVGSRSPKDLPSYAPVRHPYDHDQEHKENGFEYT